MLKISEIQKKRDCKELLQLSAVSGNPHLELFLAFPRFFWLFPVGVTQFGHNTDNNTTLPSQDKEYSDIPPGKLSKHL